MSDYLSITENDRREMLAAVGAESEDDLFECIPPELRLSPDGLSEGTSQAEALEKMKSLADMNKVYSSVFRGAGCYKHFIPPVVTALAGREEFLTSYTPYQAELSQGILQAIFEYQTMICRLTGMDVSTASHYSGATAAAEACVLCADKIKKVVTFDNIKPDTLSVIGTYLNARGIELKVLDSVDGRAVLQDETFFGAVYLESPNYFGIIEDAASIGAACKAKGGKFIIGADPVSLGLLNKPSAYGADFAVGEAASLGLSMSFGGPTLGYLAARREELRKLPGRIVGKTTDQMGNTAYVLTLQAREQHIRRERATSNICSNQAHCALTASIYLASIGPEGLREVASACVSNAHYLAEKLREAGAELRYGGEFFNEFVTVTPDKAYAIDKALDSEGILGGLPLDADRILWCCTEINKKSESDRVAGIVGGIL